MKKKLLIVAPGISQFDVGEVFIGYKWVQELSKYFDITVLTLRLKGKRTIENGELPVRLIHFEEKSGLHRFERFNAIAKPWYFCFYRDVKKWLDVNDETGDKFDWYHQITPMAARYPSPLASGCRRFSLGPVAGALPDVDSFKSELDTMSWYMKFRDVDKLRFKYDPILRGSYQSATKIIAAADYIKEKLILELGINESTISVLNELAVDSVMVTVSDLVSKFEDRNKTIKLLFVGRLVRTKGVKDLIRCLPLIQNDVDFHLDVIGTGTDLEACIDEARKLSVHNKVTFHGKMDRNDIDAFYKSADIFVFPSFREPTGGVVIEALSFGLPMIVLDHGGPQSTVNNSVAIKLNISTPQALVEDLANQITSLSLDDKRREEMAYNALEYCKKNYLWESKVKGFSHTMMNWIIEK